MFVKAYEIATQFTRPVLISHRNIKNNCFAGIGTFVIINSEGWAVTAAHIIKQSHEISQSAQKYQDTEIKKKQIYDANLEKKEKSVQLKSLPTFNDNSPINASTWWSFDGIIPSKVNIHPHIDLAFIKFDNFNPDWISHYPVFKDPKKNLKPGKSLCRIGFPFSTITPTYDESKNSFILPPGSLPLPFFPNEGIFTRNVLVQTNPPISNPPLYNLMYIETSNPGLRGQSGGPIFDVDGNICGIQSQTQHFPLGFSPSVPNGKKDEKEHQFMNIGWGIHVETLIGAMNELNISFKISDE